MFGTIVFGGREKGRKGEKMMNLDKKLLWSSLMMILLVSMTTVAMVNLASAPPEPNIYASPPEYDATGQPIGHLFPIDIYVSDAPSTFAWEIRVRWDPDVVKLFYKLEGDFLSNAGGTFFETIPSTPPWDEPNLQGEITVGCSITDPLPIESWPTGNGYLVRLGFNVTGTGSSLIDLFDTRLWDHLEGGSPAPTAYGNDDSFFYNVDPSHDIKITDVQDVTGYPAVFEGDVLSINVTVLDEGTEDESVTLNVYANLTLVDTTVLALNGSGSFENRSFTYQASWDTTGFAYGNYTIRAEVPAVGGEVDTGDNSLTDGFVFITIPGDADGDVDVDYDDFIILAGAYGSSEGEAAYDQRADFDHDKNIDYDDFIILAGNYGKTA